MINFLEGDAKALLIEKRITEFKKNYSITNAKYIFNKFDPYTHTQKKKKITTLWKGETCCKRNDLIFY